MPSFYGALFCLIRIYEHILWILLPMFLLVLIQLYQYWPLNLCTCISLGILLCNGNDYTRKWSRRAPPQTPTSTFGNATNTGVEIGVCRRPVLPRKSPISYRYSDTYLHLWPRILPRRGILFLILCFNPGFA